MPRTVIRFAAAAVVGFVASLLLNTYVVVALAGGLAGAVLLVAVVGRPGRWASLGADLRTVADRAKLVARLQADLSTRSTRLARELTEQGSALQSRLQDDGFASSQLEQALAEVVASGLAALASLTQEAAGMLARLVGSRPDRRR